MIRFFYVFFLIPLFFSVSMAQNTFTISGTVTEDATGEAMTGVTVAIYQKGSDKPLAGSYSNRYGFYSIPGVASGEYVLRASSIGYEKLEKTIVSNDGNDIKINFSLKEASVDVQEVVVEDERESEPIQSISKVSVSPQFIEKMPSLGGEVDVFRTLQLLPGVQQSTELSSGLYVRGGSPDQNLTLLDGVIVYNPSHLMGFLSTFNSDALKDIKLIKGAFPAEYGGRLSSVLDISMKEGNRKEFSGEGGISIISSKLTLEGPITEKSSFMISGRRMYLDLLTSLWGTFEGEEAPDYYFYDLNAKVNYEISERDKIFLSGYFGRDVFGFDEGEESASIKWGNSTANLRWMHIINPKLFTNFSLIYTDYQFTSEFIDERSIIDNFYTYSGIKDVMFRGEAQYFPSKNHTIKTGVEAIYHNFGSNISASFGNNFDYDSALARIYAWESAFYFQDEWTVTDRLKTNIGGRVYYFSSANYLNFEPRLMATYDITGDVTLKASGALAHQYLHLVENESIALPTDAWFPSNETIKPSRSWQAVLGAETRLFNNEYLFSIEAYYKDMQNLLAYKDSVDFSFGIPSVDQFTTGTGEAYGLEFFIHKRIGNFTGWIGYTLAWTTRQFDDINYGKPFPPRYDRRHDVSVVVNFKLSENWELGASWVYGTGQAYTMPTGSYYVPGPSSDPQYRYYEQRYQYTEKNGYRLPAFHKLDVNFMYKYEWFGIPWQVSFNLYNAYNRKNAFAWYIGREYDNSGEYKSVIKQITLFPIIPSIGLSFKF